MMDVGFLIKKSDLSTRDNNPACIIVQSEINKKLCF